MCEKGVAQEEFSTDTYAKILGKPNDDSQPQPIAQSYLSGGTDASPKGWLKFCKPRSSNGRSGKSPNHVINALPSNRSELTLNLFCLALLTSHTRGKAACEELACSRVGDVLAMAFL